MHYQRQRVTGTTDLIAKPSMPPRPRRIGVEACAVDGCEKMIKARDWCAAHYSRWQRHGSPIAQVRGEVVDGARRCPDCRQVVALEDWYVRPSGRAEKCRNCFAEWNRDRGHRRRATATGPRFTRREVLERDGWVCQLCASDIDRDLSHPHPMSATLDHIIPVSRGGEHSLENTQAAHRICNMRKWAHVTEAAS
jgi:5-methylcytosine-specific restriction endonuclease McrA